MKIKKYQLKIGDPMFFVGNDEEEQPKIYECKVDVIDEDMVYSNYWACKYDVNYPHVFFSINEARKYVVNLLKGEIRKMEDKNKKIQAQIDSLENKNENI